MELSTGPTASGSTSLSRVRFDPEGGVVERMRALLAPPLLLGGSVAVAVAGSIGSRRTVVGVERGIGRMAELLASIRLDLEGLERVDPSEQYVVVPLHEGFADVLALLRLPLGLRFAARDELFDWPTLGRYLSVRRHPRVDTVSSIASVRRFDSEVARVFEDGDNLVVFAQGSILGVEVAFQPGAMRIARRFGRPLLPVVLTGSHRVWEHPYSSTLRFGQRISMRVLDPIPAGHLDVSVFRQMERSMKRHALSGEMAPTRRFVPEVDGWWDGYPYTIDVDFSDLQRRVQAHRGDGSAIK